MLPRLIPVLLLLLAMLAQPAFAQSGNADIPEAPAASGVNTLEDILARQRGEDVPRMNRDAGSAAGQATEMLGVLGGASDSELWEDLRFGTANITTQASGPAAKVLVQDGGMRWLTFRAGPLRSYGGYLLLGMLATLALFYLLRGKIRIESGASGITIERFSAVERFAHWLLAGSFILLGITGLITLFGRVAIIPLFGHEANSILAIGAKWIHNNVSWAFVLALILVFLFWVIHNLPSRTDITWLLKGGGLFSQHSHPPAKKFNAGQKIIFWAVILLGGSISASGAALLFPFEINLFAPTFAKLNALGIPALLGMEPLPTTLAPHEEMQLAQAWHAIVSFLLMAIIIAHIYLGSVGMEGAYDAMGSGQVDVNWAREHHSLWAAEMEAKADQTPADATPAE